MKTKSALITLLVLSCAIVASAKEASINQMIASLNADAAKPGGDERVLKSISASTHVPVAILAKEKAASGLTYGDLYIAHAISNAAGKSFNDVVKLKKQGKSWDKIADENNVSIGGKKLNAAAQTKPQMKPRSTGPQQPDQSTSYKAPMSY